MGDAQIISGFVHPPTEIMFQVAFAMWNQLFYNREGIRGADLLREAPPLSASPALPRNTHRSLGTLAPGTS